jgi:lysophospholipase L1-like esterase
MQTITHPIRQLALVVAGFVVAVVLLESQGLASWADHLDIGPLRTVAVPVTGAIKTALVPLAIGGIREHALQALARVGWSDDAALLADAAGTNSPSLTKPTECVLPALSNAPNAASIPGSKPGTATSAVHPSIPGTTGTFSNAVGSQTPLLASLPRTTTLAPLPPIAPGKPRVVALAGDSMMAVGLSATLLRQAAGNKDLRVIKAFRSGTGLARPEVFNWMDEYPAMIGAEKPDVVIVAIGANDGQGFVVDGKVLPYGSEGWQKVYQDRLASYLAMVSSSGARVVWVGLPPMRIPVYNQKIAAINRIAYTVVSQSPQATWWNPDSYVGDDSGGFREFETLPNGQSMRLRATDGIHLSDEGAGLLTNVLMKWLDPPPPPSVASVGAPAPAVGVAERPAKPKRRVRHPSKG